MNGNSSSNSTSSGQNRTIELNGQKFRKDGYYYCLNEDLEYFIAFKETNSIVFFLQWLKRTKYDHGMEKYMFESNLKKSENLFTTTKQYGDKIGAETIDKNNILIEFISSNQLKVYYGKSEIGNSGIEILNFSFVKYNMPF